MQIDTDFISTLLDRGQKEKLRELVYKRLVEEIKQADVDASEFMKGYFESLADEIYEEIDREALGKDLTTILKKALHTT